MSPSPRRRRVAAVGVAPVRRPLPPMGPEANWRGGIYIGLGANLGDPIAQLRAALLALDADPDIRVTAISSLYRTPPWGPVAQAPFVNAVAALEILIDAPALVARLLEVERAGGRTRSAQRWGPRAIDLDLLLDGALSLDLPGCRVPHPRLHERAFVLVPLAEIAADVMVPGHGSVAECLQRLPSAERESARPIGALALEP